MHTLKFTSEELKELFLLLRSSETTLEYLDQYHISEDRMYACRRAVSRASGMDVLGPWETLRHKLGTE